MTPSTSPGGFPALLAWFLEAMTADVDDPAAAPIRIAVDRLRAAERDGRYQAMFLEAVAAAGGAWDVVFARAFPDIGFVARAFTETALRDLYALARQAPVPSAIPSSSLSAGFRGAPWDRSAA